MEIEDLRVGIGDWRVGIGDWIVKICFIRVLIGGGFDNIIV